MNKQEKINKIYEVIANKELSFGCRLKSNTILQIILFADPKHIHLCNGVSIKHGEYEIKGHPVMIGNCDKLIEKGPNYFDDWTAILDLWIKKEEPIEGQSDKCIEHVFNKINSLGNNQNTETSLTGDSQK